MLAKTKGIILKSVKYRESSLILSVFTRELGLKSYIISGVRKQRSGTGPAVFQVMNIVDLVVYDRESNEINRIKEVKPAFQYQHLFLDIILSSIGIFMIEVIRKCIREKEQNIPMYDFLESSLLLLDRQKDHFGSFHLFFLLNFCRYLGFMPAENYTETHCYFDMIEGKFVAAPPYHRDFLNKDKSEVFAKIAGTRLENFNSIQITKSVRNDLLEEILKYYKIHLGDFGEIRSLEIFRDIFK